MNMQDKVVIVTGSTRGIGKSIADRFLRHKAKVAICGRSTTGFAQYADEENVLALPVDVAKKQDVDQLVASVMDKWGRIDVVVNNAGITQDNLLMRMSDEQWQNVLDVNLTGAFYLCRSVIRPMMKQRFGRIVNISSVIGVMGNAGQANYAASKAGLIGFSKSLAKEVASRGILVNVVAPGYIDTDMTRALSENQRSEIVGHIPLGRTGSGDDVANAVAFLASEENSYITGQVLHVDGGLVI